MPILASEVPQKSITLIEYLRGIHRPIPYKEEYTRTYKCSRKNCQENANYLDRNKIGMVMPLCVAHKQERDNYE